MVDEQKIRRFAYFTQNIMPKLKPYSKYKMTDFEKSQIQHQCEEIPDFDIKKCQDLCDIYHSVK